MLDTKQKERLLKQLSMLGSNFENEQIAALTSIHRTLENNNLTFNDFIQSLQGSDYTHAYNSGFSDGFIEGRRHKDKQIDYKAMLQELDKQKEFMNAWSESFVENCLKNYDCWNLTDKQKAIVEKLHRKFCGKNS